jgi:hypothetical protein
MSCGQPVGNHSGLALPRLWGLFQVRVDVVDVEWFIEINATS